MSIVADQIHSILRASERRSSSSRSPKEGVSRPSAAAPGDGVTISLEAKKRQLVDQIVGQVVREISAQAGQNRHEGEKGAEEGRVSL